VIARKDSHLVDDDTGCRADVPVAGALEGTVIVNPWVCEAAQVAGS